MRDTTAIEAGMVFERDHPFTLVVENKGDPDFEIERWRPGAWNVVEHGPEEALACANAIGKVKFTVVSIHQPPGYQTRVFYKRQFFMPDGEAYASGSLKNCIISKFRRDIRGFPFEYTVEDLWDGDHA
nr:hypothetical protein [Brucella intermedia]